MPLVVKVTLLRADFTEPELVLNLNEKGIKGIPTAIAHGNVSEQECLNLGIG